MNSALTLRKACIWGVPGVLMGGLTLLIEKFALISENPVIAAIQGTVLTLITPGLIGSMAVGNNVHAFSLAVAALINAVLYFVLGLISFTLFTKIRSTIRGE